VAIARRIRVREPSHSHAIAMAVCEQSMATQVSVGEATGWPAHSSATVSSSLCSGFGFSFAA